MTLTKGQKRIPNQRWREIIDFCKYTRQSRRNNIVQRKRYASVEREDLQHRRIQHHHHRPLDRSSQRRPEQFRSSGIRFPSAFQRLVFHLFAQASCSPLQDGDLVRFLEEHEEQDLTERCDHRAHPEDRPPAQSLGNDSADGGPHGASDERSEHDQRHA